KLEILIPAGKIASLKAGEIVGMIASDATEKYTGQYNTSAINCKVNLNMKAIAKEEMNFKELPDFYDFGENKDETLRENFEMINDQIEELVYAYLNVNS